MESPVQPTLRTPNSWVRMHRARPLYASLTITTGAREAPSDQFFHQPPAFRHLPHVPEAPLIQAGVWHTYLAGCHHEASTSLQVRRPRSSRLCNPACYISHQWSLSVEHI
jgi:hypothetical protein